MVYLVTWFVLCIQCVVAININVDRFELIVLYLHLETIPKEMTFDSSIIWLWTVSLVVMVVWVRVQNMNCFK